MRYTIAVNQLQADELGIPTIKHAHIFSLLGSCSTWAEPVLFDKRVFYWVARQKICTELKLLKLKPDTIYRYLKSLAELGLIEYRKSGKKDCILITELGKTYYGGKKSEMVINPMSEKFPNSKKTLSRKEIRGEAEKFPTYPNYKNNNKEVASSDNTKVRMTAAWEPALSAELIGELHKKGITKSDIEEQVSDYKISMLAKPSERRTKARWDSCFVQTLLRPKTANQAALSKSSKLLGDSLMKECEKFGIYTVGKPTEQLQQELRERLENE